MSFLTLSFAFFLVTNPLGQAPLFLSLIKNFDLRRQKIIMLRELAASFGIALFFLILGGPFLEVLHVKNYTVSICGGIILFLVAMDMIYQKTDHDPETRKVEPSEPFIVPIATPLLAGPCLLTTIILYAAEEGVWTVFLGLAGAWVMCGAVLLATPYLQIIFGKRGLVALEQLMGMLLTCLSTEMALTGVYHYLHRVQ